MATYDRWDYNIKSCCYTPGYDGEFNITTNRVTDLFNGWAGVSYEFTPVSFTNQMIGFKIRHIETLSGEFDDKNITSTNTFYVALSDTPVEVGEADVDNPNLAKMEDED